MSKPVSDLSWGDPIVVRQALVKALGRTSTLFASPLSEMAYPPHLGSPDLIDQLKTLAERQSGDRPKHLTVTCGATGAIHAALYALKTVGTEWVITDKRYYPMYPRIIAMADMAIMDKERGEGLKKSHYTEHSFITLATSPSAPEGLVCPFESVDIWDSAYASKTYSRGGHVPKKWRIMCGSLSKTLGLSGLRLGWVATNDDLLANSLSNYVTNSYIGLSSISQSIAKEVLDTLDLDKFESLSAGYLDGNREEVQKLLDRFGQGSVPTRGMFAILQLGKAERKALERANIKWQPGSTWGEDDSWARLSLGQTREVVRAAVRAALK